LEANTATFSGDLGKASGKLKVFADDAEAAGERVDFSMREARGSLMLMGDEFGIHLPREIRTMIAEMPGIGIALESLLPIMGAVFAVGMIAKWMEAHKKAQEELATGWAAMGSQVIDTMSRLGDKLLEVAMETDTLAGDHLGALKLRLELVDRQTMSGIISEFKKAETEADKLLGKMDSNWFMKMIGDVDTGPAQDALKKVGTALDKIRSTDNDPAKAVAVLSQGIVDATTKFDALADARRKAAGVIKDSSQDKFLAAHLTSEETAWNKVVEVLRDQMEEAQARVQIGTGEKGNDSTERAQKDAEAWAKQQEASQKFWAKDKENIAKDVEEAQKFHDKQVEATERAAKEEADATQAVAEWEAKVQQGLANETLKQSITMGKLKEASDDQAAKHKVAMRQSTAKEATEAEVKAANEHAKNAAAALDQEIASLDKHDALYLVKLKEFENKKQQLIKQTENEVTKIREQAEEKQYQDIRKAEERMADAVAKNVAKSLVESKNMAQGFEDMGKQMLEAATENMVKMILLGDMKQAKDAAHAAGSAFKWVMEDVPFPLNAALAPAAAAAAFAGVMAFEQGGAIPGSGPVPIIGHGGETVVTKALTDRVEASEGRGKGRKPVTINMQVITKDADSFKASQSQLHSKAFHAADKASKRNR
jgi:hypothetical protein